MTIGICIPFYLRGKAINQAYVDTFTHYAGLGYTVILCGSEGEMSRKFSDRFLSDKIHYVEVPQDSFCDSSGGDDSLRKKFNDSLLRLTDFGNFDWFCLVGADDIVPKETFHRLELSNANNVAMAGVGYGQPLFIQPVDRSKIPFKVTLAYKVKLLPGLNAFSRPAMIASGWKPYQMKGCETGAEKYFTGRGMIIQLPGYVLMIKGTQVLNTVSHIRSRHPFHACTPEEIKLVRSHF